MTSPLTIDYYTDILCVWAWISQRRINELQEQWGDRIELRRHYINLFGNTETRIGKRWEDRGGFNGFGQHVIEASAPYTDAPVNPEIWKTVRPATSANAHLILKAVDVEYSSDISAALAQTLQHAFFVDCMDLGKLEVVLSIAEDAGLDSNRLYHSIKCGTASAALMADYQLAQEKAIKGSPSWIMNNGRQTLFGNVGYRVLNANVEETLKHPEQEASWC